MSHGVPVLVSDIPGNKEIGLPVERYFRCGDVSDLKEKNQFRDSGIANLGIIRRGTRGDTEPDRREI